MASRTDLKLINNDVQILNNDLVLAESDDQHIADTLNAFSGWWKQFPSDGVGVMQYFKGRNVQQELARSIQINLKSDGYNARPIISFDSSGNLIIDTNVTV